MTLLEELQFPGIGTVDFSVPAFTLVIAVAHLLPVRF